MKKLDPKTYEYAMKDMGQLNEKLLMNSDYGAGGSPITYFYNLYCAVSTTATGQSMISTAMCCFEDFFSDNVRFIDFDDCSNYISNIISEPFNGDLSLVEDKKAHEVFERLKDKFIEYKDCYNHPLFSMLLNLDQDNLNRIYYKNNLYGFARLPKVKKLLFKIIVELYYIRSGVMRKVFKLTSMLLVFVITIITASACACKVGNESNTTAVVDLPSTPSFMTLRPMSEDLYFG